MPAANTDLLKKYKSLFSTTLTTGIGTGTGDTITPSTVTGLPTDTAITLTFDRVNSGGSSLGSQVERITGVISGGNLTSYIRGQDDTTEQAHSGGAVIEMVWNAQDWNDMVDWGLAEHNQDGTHDATKVATISDTQTFTGAKTFGSGLLITTKPKITTSIDDANGNEVIKTPATSSAVNEITVTNAATGNKPKIEATGGDTNIDLDLRGKGTGTVMKPSTVIIQVFDGATDTATGDGKAYFTIPEELNGMNLVGVHARVVTAGTTGTTDIQIANVTDSVDMLSTKLTIDSGETGSDTAATPAVIDTTKDDVATNDLLRIDCDAVSTTKAKGLIVRLRFALP